MAQYHSLSKELQERILEDREKHKKNPYAFPDEKIVRRRVDHDKANLWRPAFVRDVEKIMHVPYYNRYSDKTQVFSFYQNDDISRRALHVQLVSRIARNIGSVLGLNESLIEAISLGHDIGHTPFGHAGEYVLNEICEDGFRHNEQSVRIVEKLEKNGMGLNLTWEVRDGILNHQSKSMPHTLEGKVVRLSDKIAYVYHDVDDAIRAEILTEDDIPLEIRKTLGFTTKQRLNTLIHNVIMNSMDQDDIRMSADIQEAMFELRHFMFDHVYTNPIAKGEEVKAKAMIRQLFGFYKDHIEFLPEKYLAMLDEGEKTERVICDYIAGMTDQYAITKFSEYFLPQAWQVDGY